MTFERTNPYESSLVAAKQELEQRKKELADLQRRVEWLEDVISSLTPLAGVPLTDSTPSGTGTIGDLVSAVLSSNAGRPMTLAEIRKVIDAMGIRFKKPENASSAINITLRRLAAKEGSAIKIDDYGTDMIDRQPVKRGPMKFIWDASVPKPSPNILFSSEM